MQATAGTVKGICSLFFADFVCDAVFRLWFVETSVTFRILPCQAGLNIETIDIDSCKHSCLVTYLILQTYGFHLLIVYRQRFDKRERGIDSDFSSPVACHVFDLDILLGVVRETEWKYQQYNVNFLHDYFFFLTDQPNLPTNSPNP